MAVTETVKIVFEVDDKALVSTVSQLQAVGKISQEDAAKFNALSQASKAAGASLDGASKGAKQFADASKDVAKSTSEVAKSAGELKNIGPSLAGAGQAADTAGDGFVSLRTQIKEAKDELQRLTDEFGASSVEAQDAARSLAALTKQSEDLQKQVTLLKPENKVAAFERLGSGIVGAFQVATGALQAFGVENEQVQQVAQKLQGALNIVSGLKSITELKDAYEDVKTVLGFTTAAQETLTTATVAGSTATTGAATATRGFAAALTSTGIGAIVVALGALVGAMMLLGDETDETSKKSARLLELEAERKRLAGDAVSSARALAVARGEISDIDAKRLEQEQRDTELIKEKSAELAKLQPKYQILRKELDTFLAAGYSAEDFFGARSDEARNVIQGYEAIQGQLDEIRKNAVNNALILNEDEKKANQDKNQKELEDTKRKLKEQKDAETAAAEERKQAKLKALDDELAALAEAQRGALIGVNDEIQRIAITDSFRAQITAKQIERAKLTGESITLIEQKAANDQKQSFEDLVAANEAQRDKDVADAEKAAKDKLDAERKAIDEALALNKLDNLIAFQKQSIALNIQLNQRKGESDQDYAKRKEQILRDLDRIERELRIANLKSELDAQDKKLKKLKEAGKEGTDEYKKAAKEQEVTSNELTQAQTDNANKVAEATTKTSKKSVEVNADVLNQYIEQAQAAFDLVADIQRERTQREIDDLDQQRKKGLITEEQYQEKLAAIKRKQAVADKNAAIFAATLQFSQALINALTITPSTAAPAALALAAAIAGANLAKIIATPLPKFKQGTLAVPGYDTGEDSVMAMLRPGEAVIPTEMNREYAQTIKAIYTRKVSAKELNDFVSGRMSVVKDEPVFNFNPITMDALFKRDLRVSRINSAVDRASGGIMPTINVKADVDTYALGKVISKNKSMEVTNVESIGEAVAEALTRRTNRRQQI